MIVFLERSGFGRDTQDATIGYKAGQDESSDLLCQSKPLKSPVKDMWLTVASIALLAAIGFVVLSLAVQWRDLTRKPDNGD